MREIYSRSKSLIALSLILCFSVSAFAQTAGKIAGTVTDNGTGEGLPGANVVIVGTSLGASADTEGRYFILNVPPGVYTVRASFIGYQAVSTENVRTSVGLTSEVDFGLATTVVEGEELVVTAATPLVEKSLTASQTTIGVSEIDNKLPVASLNDILETTPSTFRGYVRGGRKYETKILVDGINISDPYFAGGTGGNQVIQTYTQARRSEGGETGVVSVNAGLVSELAVLAGTFSAEYDAATAGVINITSRSGGSKLSGKVFLRSSAGGLDHAGPDVYKGSFQDLDKFLQERQNHLNSGDAARVQRAGLMTFNQGTIDEIGYGDDPAIDGELSLGGPLASKANFFLSGRILNTHGRFPGEFDREVTSSLKLNYNLTNSDKLTGNLIVNDGGILGGWKNRTFSARYKYFPEGNPQNEKLGLVGYLAWTKTLSPNTFFEIRGSYTGRTSRFGYSDDNNDGVISRGEDGDFLMLETAEQALKYLGDAGGGIITDTDGNQIRTAFTGDPANDAFPEAQYPGTNQYRFAQPGFFYEELKRNALQIKGDITSQVTYNHQLKGGFLFRRHTIEDFQQRTQVKVLYNPTFPYEQTSYSVHPTEFAVYLQDRIEYEGIIINAGLRLDAFDTGANQFGDFFNVSMSDTLANGSVVRREVRTDDIPTKWFFGPRLGISHPITDNAAMHYSWGRFFSPPPFAELFENFGVIDSPSLPQLRDVGREPPETTAYEIGLQWEFIPDYLVNTTAYYRDIKNYSTIGYSINPATGGFGSYTYLTSFGYADARGIEISLQKRPAGWLSGRASYAYSYIKAARNAGNISDNKTSFAAASDDEIPFDDRDQFNTYSANVNGGGNPLESGFDREHRFSLTFLLDLPYDIAVTGISSAESGFWYNVTATSDDPREREQRLSPWTARTDLRVSKGFGLGGVRNGRIFLEGRNIFDTENILTWDNYNITSTTLWEEEEDPRGDLQRATTLSGLPLYDIAREFYVGVEFSF
jgi:outer membrane receptor protein involved in Fe transport